MGSMADALLNHVNNVTAAVCDGDGEWERATHGWGREGGADGRDDVAVAWIVRGRWRAAWHVEKKGLSQHTLFCFAGR